jgi:hypothetical protein
VKFLFLAGIRLIIVIVGGLLATGIVRNFLTRFAIICLLGILATVILAYGIWVVISVFHLTGFGIF